MASPSWKSFAVALTATLALCLTLAVVSAGVSSDKRLAIPDGPAQAAARKLVHDVYRADYAGLTPATRGVLAKRLIQQAEGTTDDPAARFAMLDECIELAITGEPPLAMTAAQRLAALYQVDELGRKSSALMKASTVPRRPAVAESFARCCLDVWSLAIVHDDYDIAARMIFLAEAAARDAKKADIAAMCADRRKDTAVIKNQFEQSRSAAAVLAKSASDEAANLAVGRFVCFVKGDWAGGLPHLAGGSDADLCRAARADLAEPTDGGDRVAAGNLWWDLAERNTGIARRNLLQRAGVHYRAALATAYSGIHKANAQQRLTLIDEQRLKDLHLEHGLLGEMFDDAKFARLMGTRTDATIDFNWGGEPAAPNLPRDNFSIRWSGRIIIPRKGDYIFLIHVNSGMRLFIDGKQVLEEANGAMKRNGVRATVPLEEGFIPIRIDFWDGGGDARIQLQWISPGAMKEEILPESALCHDPAE